MPDNSLAKLIVECGFASVSLGMRAELLTIMNALPDLVEDIEQRRRCKAIFLIGLGRRRAANACINKLSDDDRLILSPYLAYIFKESLS